MLNLIKESLKTIYDKDESYTDYQSHVETLNYIERNDDCSVDWVNRKLQEILNYLSKKCLVSEYDYVLINHRIATYLIGYLLNKPTDE